MRKLAIAWLLVLLQSTCLANVAQPVAADPGLEKRVMALTENLRCLVCQNQTIADSHADLAIDLKKQVREQLARGASEQEVLDYMVARYGDFVLYRPPVKPTTWLLWFGPFGILICSLLFLRWKLQQRRPENFTLSDADMQRAAALLNATEQSEATLHNKDNL